MALTQVQGGMLAGSTNTTTTIQSNGTTAITIDSSQNVGIGVATPTGKLAIDATNSNTPRIVFKNPSANGDGAISTFVSSTGTDVILGSNAYINSSGNFARFDSAQAGSYVYANRTGLLLFGTNDTSGVATERMRIDSSGNLLVGTTNSSIGNNFTTVGTGNSALNLNSSGTSNTYTTLGFFNQNNYQAQIFWQQSNDNFYVQNNNNGVYLSANATSWTANSDERLKENLVPIENGLEKVCSLRSVIGNFKSDETKKPRPFLIAQDVQAVLPEAVSSSRIKGDETQIEYLGVAYTEVIPLLVASIKELNAKVDAQAAEIAALKAAP